jgi:hypothetical protein
MEAATPPPRSRESRGGRQRTRRWRPQRFGRPRSAADPGLACRWRPNAMERRLPRSLVIGGLPTLQPPQQRSWLLPAEPAAQRLACHPPHPARAVPAAPAAGDACGEQGSEEAPQGAAATVGHGLAPLLTRVGRGLVDGEGSDHPDQARRDRAGTTRLPAPRRGSGSARRSAAPADSWWPLSPWA